MSNCSSFFMNCLFEKDVSKVKYEFIKGIEYKRASGLIRSILGNIDVVVHYLPWTPPRLIVSLEFARGRMICLFDSGWGYSDEVSGDKYEEYLDFQFSELEDEDK
jgi:hypothetical protein